MRQTAYPKKILEQFGLLDCNPTTSLMEPKLKVKKDEDGEKVDPTEYRRVVGCLRYLTRTRPNLSLSVGIASRFMEEPTTLHFQVVKHILRYVKGTVDYGLNNGRGCEIEDLIDFTDSDLGGDPVDSKSTSGMIFYLGRNVITWQSQKQKDCCFAHM